MRQGSNLGQRRPMGLGMKESKKRLIRPNEEIETILNFVITKAGSMMQKDLYSPFNFPW